MKMMILKVSALSLMTSLCFAGPRSSGGGFAVVCPETPVSAASAELLDIYEIEREHTVVPVAGDLAKEYVAAVGRINARLGAPDYVQRFRDSIQKNLTRFFQSVVWITQSNNLPVANDLGKTPWIPSQCKIQQMAYFDDASERIYVDQALFQKLNPRDQAALVFHELLFREARDQGESTSLSSRRTTGLAFVSSALDPVFPIKVPKEKMHYFSDANVAEQVSGITAHMSAALFKSVGYERTVVIFESLFGRPVQSFTAVDFDPVDLEFEDRYVDTPPGPRVIRVIKTPNLKIDQKASVRGQSFGGLGYEVRIHGETGSSLYLDLLQDGVTIQSAYLSR